MRLKLLAGATLLLAAACGSSTEMDKTPEIPQMEQLQGYGRTMRYEITRGDGQVCDVILFLGYGAHPVNLGCWSK